MWRKKRRRLSLCVGLWMCRVTEHNDHVDFFPVRPVYHVYMMEPGQSRGAAGLCLFSNTLFDNRSREKRQRRRRRRPRPRPVARCFLPVFSVLSGVDGLCLCCSCGLFWCPADCEL